MGIVVALIVVLIIAITILVVYLIIKNKKDNFPQDWRNFPRQNGQELHPTNDSPKPAETTEVNSQQLKALTDFVRLQQEQTAQKAMAKEVHKVEMREKLENFRQTKQSLKETLKSQLESKQWQHLNRIINSLDKGNMGIYVIYNETKNKYYVGQAKQLYKRVRDHFKVEQMALDFLAGDKMHVKTLEAGEIDTGYRLDHVEKTAIEIFHADTDGYNKNNGNL